MAEQGIQEDELPLETVGRRLRNAREAAGLSRDDISMRTKIAERHLIAIEEDRFSDLAGKTYAIGFARSYARAAGLNETAIADAVRVQLAGEQEHWPAPEIDTFEPGDPARVPPFRLAWIAGLGAIVVFVLLFVFWRSFISPAGSLPDLTGVEQPQVEASAPPAATAPAQAAGGPVVFTALEPGIWVKFYDASGTQLFQKQMSQGETYTVPADAEGPQIWTARPDALHITIGGKAVPGLGDKPVTVKDFPVSAAALLARDAGEAADTASDSAVEPIASASETPATDRSAGNSSSSPPSPPPLSIRSSTNDRRPSALASAAPQPSAAAPTPRPSARPTAASTRLAPAPAASVSTASPKPAPSRVAPLSGAGVSAESSLVPVAPSPQAVQPVSATSAEASTDSD